MLNCPEKLGLKFQTHFTYFVQMVNIGGFVNAGLHDESPLMESSGDNY
jgi:hypothetical protein